MIRPESIKYFQKLDKVLEHITRNEDGSLQVNFTTKEEPCDPIPLRLLATIHELANAPSHCEQLNRVFEEIWSTLTHESFNGLLDRSKVTSFNIMVIGSSAAINVVTSNNGIYNLNLVQMGPALRLYLAHQLSKISVNLYIYREPNRNYKLTFDGDNCSFSFID